ncbi:hypothetical protein [Thioalbus denitrificans]|uniref:Uncharacterized protein n=1 Tax=Thioalbus denitrificans TaxID=547122 RepID=A0A369CDI7_9GAMM|nr:hypothetical protein [Thioalbus denitrificans]RCX32102.1 hypothetical protein DFQ59_102455 [Thioalbus denitrificans]
MADIHHNRLGAMVRLCRPLSDLEQRAWRRWHRGMTVMDVLAHRVANRTRFPVVNGGRAPA